MRQILALLLGLLTQFARLRLVFFDHLLAMIIPPLLGSTNELGSVALAFRHRKPHADDFLPRRFDIQSSLMINHSSATDFGFVALVPQNRDQFRRAAVAAIEQKLVEFAFLFGGKTDGILRPF